MNYRIATLCLLILLAGCETDRSGNSLRSTDTSGITNPSNNSEAPQLHLVAENPGSDAVSANNPARAPAPKEIVIGNYAEPTSLDPHFVAGFTDLGPLNDLLEGLVLHGADGKLVPGAAERWESADARHYTFHLRRNARWSNGEPLTAKDFVYAWRRAVDPATGSGCSEAMADAGLANASAIIAGELAPESLGIRAREPHTLEMTLEQPLSYFTSLLITPCYLPLYAPAIAEHGEGWTRPERYVGNGAFSLQSWSVNESLVLTRNTSYWAADRVQLDQVTFLPIASAQAELRRYLAGEIDVTHSAPSEQLAKLRAGRPGEVIELLEPMTFGIEINQSGPPYDNPDLRKALALALDRELLVNKVLKIGKPAYHFTPPAVHANHSEGHPWVGMSQDEREVLARELYARAGYSRKNPLRFRVFHKNNDDTQKVLTAAAAMWKRVLGAEASIQGFELRSLIPLVQEMNYDLATRGRTAVYPDEFATLISMLSGRSDANGYSNPELDQAVQQALVERDAEIRKQLHAQAEQLLAEDMPFIPLYNRGTARLIKPHVRGYQPSPLGYRYSKDLWIAQQAQKPSPSDDRLTRTKGSL